MIAMPTAGLTGGGGGDQNGAPTPPPPRPMVDFCSGSSFQSLHDVIEHFDNQDRHEFDDQMALEVHSMKEHLFTLLGKIQAIDGRLPGANEYLLLSGSARDGTVDLEIQSPTSTPEPPSMPELLLQSAQTEVSDIVEKSEEISTMEEPSNVYLLTSELDKVGVNGETTLTPDSQETEVGENVQIDQEVEPEVEAEVEEEVTLPEPPLVPQANPLDADPVHDKLLLTRGQDFDLDYTLLVPVLRAHERQQLDLKGCEAGESTVPIDQLQDPQNFHKWTDCMQHETSTLSAIRVWNWFVGCLEKITDDARAEEKKGRPRILLAAPSGCPKRSYSLILIAGGTRILYDLVPCISFRGWPQIAAAWLQETGRFWQRAGLPHSEAAGAFHLLPGRGRNGSDWRFCFARSEVQLKKLVPAPFMKVFYCWRSVLGRALSRQRQVLRPYALRAIFFWACDRVKNSYLSREDQMPAFFCGLIDDVLQALLSRSCPSYFLPQINLLDKSDDATILSLAQIILMVRSDPVEQIRNTLEQVAAARGLTQVHNEQSYGKKRVISGIDSSGQALYTHVRSNDDPRQEQNQESLAERVKRMVAENKGSSISVFLNPNDVSRYHFRVDSKFT